MQTVSGGFTTASQAAVQRPLTYVEVSWDGAGVLSDDRADTHWTDETPYLLSCTTRMRIEPPGEDLVPAGDIGSADVVLNNLTGRYNWQDTDGASPLTAYITGATAFTGLKLRIWQGFAGEYVKIFTGVITSFTPVTAEGTLRLQCKDIGWLYLQDKQSSPVSYDKLPDEWIDLLAAQAGISTSAIDVGIFPIPYCWLDDESIVEEVWQTAEADGGLAYFGAGGYLRFENALHWASHGTVWTFTENAYRRAETSVDTDAVATEITIEWSGRAEAPEEVIYTLERPKVVAPGATETWTARFQYAVTGIFTPSVVAPLKDYAAVSIGGVDITASLTITISDLNAQQASISVKNRHTTSSANITFLQLRGMPLVGGPTEQESVLVTPAPFTFKRVRALRSNPYLQTQAQGKALANLMAVRCKSIRPVWTLHGVPCIPQLELCDEVSFVDVQAQGAGNARTCVIVGITSSWSLEGGAEQTFTLWDNSDLAAYTDYFIIGTTALGATGGRCYY